MGVRQFIRAAMGRLLPRSLFLVGGPPGRGVAYLTFDDGPHPEHTPAILDTLASEGVRATFFIVGQRAAEHPDLVRRIVAEGHALGHHTYTHSAPADTSAAGLGAEIRQTAETLQALVGFSPALFRPPHGSLSPAKLWRVWRMGLSVVLWTVDPKDFARASAEDLRHWFTRHPVRGGDVVLLHDTSPHTGPVLAALIRDGRDRGLTFAALVGPGRPGLSSGSTAPDQFEPAC